MLQSSGGISLHTAVRECDVALAIVYLLGPAHRLVGFQIEKMIERLRSIGNMPVSGEEHGGIGLVSIEADEIAHIGVIEIRGEIRSGSSFGIAGADDDLGRAQFVRHCLIINKHLLLNGKRGSVKIIGSI